MKKTAATLVLAGFTLASCSSPLDQPQAVETVRPAEELQEAEIGDIADARNPMTLNVARVTVHRAILTNSCVYGFREGVDTSNEPHELLTVDLEADVVQGEAMVLDQVFIEYGNLLGRAFPTAICLPAGGAKEVTEILDPEDGKIRVTGTYVVNEGATAYVIGGKKFPLESA